MRALRWHATSAINDYGRSIARREVWLHHAQYTVCLSVALILTILRGYPNAQISSQGDVSAPTPAVPGFTEPASIPAVLSPLETAPSPQERLLAPVPAQFNWLERETPSNPFLEALLGVQRPARLLVTASLTEDVSDNFAQSPTNRQTDARTEVVLGTVYRLDDGQNFVSLANTVRAFYQARSAESQFGFANLALNAGYQLLPLSFGLAEIFTRDDNTSLGPTQPLLRPQQKFIRNSVSPQVRYDITPLTAATLSYTNILVIDEDIDSGTTTTHTVTPGISHQFSPNLSGSMYYTFTTSNDSGTTPSSSGTTSTGAFAGHSHSLTTTLGYQLDPKTSISTSAFGAIVERTETGARDSRTYGASLGVRRVLFSTVSLFGSIGPTVFKLEGEKPKLRANWQLTLDSPLPLTPLLTLTLTTSQSILDTVSEVNSEGLVLRQLATARLTYTPKAFLSGALFVEYTRTAFLEDTNVVGTGTREPETLSSIGVTASYALTKSLSLTGFYRYQRRDSKQPGANFDENRVTLAVTGTFPIF